jgi:formate hydrogenlyase transcriptional activator
MATISRLSEARTGLADPPTYHASVGIVGRSAAVRRVMELVERVASTDVTVLIVGETGTGKEITARVIHRLSRRAARRLVAVSLGAIPETLVAAELFGHEAGAFTGAGARRVGRFELADHATLFLDEIAEMAFDNQVALLRVLQEGEFERLGGTETLHVDVRVIAATNRDLEREVGAGRFREDLFYRLNIFPIELPPLRKRAEDIPELAAHFLALVAPRLGRRFTSIEPASLERLVAFSWPGNIRQLQNVIERSAILCERPELHVPAELLRDHLVMPDETSALRTTLHCSEVDMIRRALEDAGGRIAGAHGAAVRLGLPPSTLESKIRRYRIDKLQYLRSHAGR